MNAVVLAGTFDWGECPLALAAPRPLVPIANRPLIDYGLNALRSAGAKEVAICANGSGKKVERVLGEGTHLGLRLHYVEDPMPRGPAGCVRDAAALLGRKDCIVIEGSLLPDVDLGALVRAHRTSGAALSIGVDKSVPEGRWSDGISPHLLGVYVFSPSVLSHIPERGYQDIKEGLVGNLHRAEAFVQACGLDGSAMRVTGPESYLAVNGWAIERLAEGRLRIEGYRQNGEAFVHPTAAVASTARLAGPVIIGPHTVIRDEAILVGPVSIGARCDLGARSVVCFSAVWNDVAVGSGSHIQESILANHVIVPEESEISGTVRLPQVRPSQAQAARETSVRRLFATLRALI